MPVLMKIGHRVLGVVRVKFWAFPLTFPLTMLCCHYNTVPCKCVMLQLKSS